MATVRPGPKMDHKRPADTTPLGKRRMFRLWTSETRRHAEDRLWRQLVDDFPYPASARGLLGEYVYVAVDLAFLRARCECDGSTQPSRDNPSHFVLTPWAREARATSGLLKDLGKQLADVRKLNPPPPPTATPAKDEHIPPRLRVVN